MGVTSCATLPFPPETHVFSTVFKLLQANSTLFKHLWLVTLNSWEGMYLSAVNFSTSNEVVPEPATATLGLFGLSALLLRHRR
ncbi:PEP-CTERM sorting domain-containing protein [Akkermansia muciniphila]|uniref:PEP-CTERM sorting domain-containing protein n=1 Tax=Akkermansia muciniphila TaxID=239935 RepID=UPI003CCC5FBA